MSRKSIVTFSLCGLYFAINRLSFGAVLMIVLVHVRSHPCQGSGGYGIQQILDVWDVCICTITDRHRSLGNKGSVSPLTYHSSYRLDTKLYIDSEKVRATQKGVGLFSNETDSSGDTINEFFSQISSSPSSIRRRSSIIRSRLPNHASSNLE